MLNRRLFLAGGLALAVPAATLPARAETSRIAVAFVGFQSCPYCKVWRTQSEPAFLASAAFGKLDYYVIDPAQPSMTLEEEYWPKAAQWMLLEFLMSDESALHGHITPRFMIGRNGQIDLTATGNRGWAEKIWPRIQALTRSPG
jgi:hypothetical protein